MSYQDAIRDLVSMVDAHRRKQRVRFSGPNRGLLMALVGDWDRSGWRHHDSLREKGRRWMGTNAKPPWDNRRLTKSWPHLSRSIIRSFLFACPTKGMLGALMELFDREGLNPFPGEFLFVAPDLQKGTLGEAYRVGVYEVLNGTTEAADLVHYAFAGGCFPGLIQSAHRAAEALAEDAGLSSIAPIAWNYPQEEQALLAMDSNLGEIYGHDSAEHRYSIEKALASQFTSALGAWVVSEGSLTPTIVENGFRLASFAFGDGGLYREFTGAELTLPVGSAVVAVKADPLTVLKEYFNESESDGRGDVFKLADHLDTAI